MAPLILSWRCDTNMCSTEDMMHWDFIHICSFQLIILYVIVAEQIMLNYLETTHL